MLDQYIFSGSLPENASTYVTREADAQLYEGLKAGKFCYVLNSRQSGKSSLRVRTMQRLREDGVQCAAVDLSAGGIQNVPSEQWYADLIDTLIDSFGLDIDFGDWWQANQLNTLVTRFRKFLEEVLLVEVQDKIVIFIDEIDSVLSLNFPTDDFFALIRACYNKRVDNPQYNRLTFCLLGVASPSNLIEDKQRTPFNIGQAISLKGFQLHEVEPLENGLRGRFSYTQIIMQEILHWTGGQPFMTQKLCQFMVEESEQECPRSVEQVVRSRIIENWESQDEPEHLRTIQARILRDEQRAGYLLELYQQVQLAEEQSQVIADETLEQSELQLSGLVVRHQDKLRIHNQIYREIFNSNWIEAQLNNLRPYSENFRFWVASGSTDESRLLRGKALQEALEWIKDKNLSYQDRQFLAASKEKEIQEEIVAREQEAALERERKDREAVETRNKVLSEANKKAQNRINIGTIILILTLLITTVLVVVAGKEVLRARNARQEAKKALQAQIKAEETAKEIEKIAQSKVRAADDRAKIAQSKVKAVEDRARIATQNLQQIRQEVASSQEKLQKAQDEAQLAIKNKKDADNRVEKAKKEVASSQEKLQKAQEEAQLAIKNRKDAEGEVRQARDALDSVKNKHQQAVEEIDNLSLLATLGGELYKIDKSSEAEQAWKQTALSLTIKDDRLRQAMLLSNMSKAYEQLGNLNKANEAVSKSLNILTPILTPKGYQTLDVEVDRANFADKLVLLAQAFNTKGRQLTVQKDIQGALSAHTEAFDILQSLYNNFNSISPAIKVSFGYLTESVYRELVNSLLRSVETGSNQQNYQKALRINKFLKKVELNNFFGEQDFNNKYLEAKLDQIEKPAPTEAVIYPFILNDRIVVAVKLAGKEQIFVYSENIQQQEAEKTLTELRRKLVTRSTREFLPLSQKVYNWLIKPIESELSANKVDTLVFDLDGELRNIPIASLYDGKKYLIEKYAISLSAGLPPQNPQPFVQRQLKALIAGLTQPSSEFSNFDERPSTESEINLISRAGGVSITSLLDQQFTSISLEQEVSKVRFNVLHLATYCQFSSRADQTFILAADGPINIKQFGSLLRSRAQNSRRPIELLVLSGCNTVTGDDKRAGLGLVGTAVKAGARSTLATLWYVNDESTANLMGEFYKQLANTKVSKAEALKQAQLLLLKDPAYKDLYKHPYYWAPYVLVGN